MFIDPSGLYRVNTIDYARAMGAEVREFVRDGVDMFEITYGGMSRNFFRNSGYIQDYNLNAIFGWSSFLTQAERNAGVGISIISGNLYRNLTVPVTAMLISNANEARARRGSGSSVTVTRDFTVVTPNDYLWIMANFGAGERWDFKYRDSWVDQFPGFAFDEFGLFVVNGVRMKAADLGNVNFGFVASALGVNTLVQLAGAGAAHVMDHGISLSQIPHLGDSPRCRHFTAMGRRWYRQGTIR